MSNKSGDDGRSCTISAGKIFTHIVIPIVGGIGLIVAAFFLWKRWKAKKKEAADKKEKEEEEKKKAIS